MKVKKNNLLIIASVVWMIAGANVLKIGLTAYKNHISFLNIIISIAVFLFFWFMVFFRLTKKHTIRIISYEEEKQFFLKFFDVKSFIIMAVMITGGILLRKKSNLPEVFFAVFYTGLGAALFGAGLVFMINYVKHNCLKKDVLTQLQGKEKEKSNK